MILAVLKAVHKGSSAEAGFGSTGLLLQRMYMAWAASVKARCTALLPQYNGQAVLPVMKTGNDRQTISAFCLSFGCYYQPDCTLAPNTLMPQGGQMLCDKRSLPPERRECIC